jgi:hypothetical protein
MPVLKRNARGVNDIRTHAGMSSERKMPHQAYLRIACLEMEKFRRGMERDSAAARVEIIDERTKEIEAEESALLRSLEKRKSDPAVAAKAAMAESAEDAGHNSRGFRLKY